MTPSSDTSTDGRLRWWGAIVSAITLCLALIRLGATSLWSDEAVTGLLGAHILKFGLPRVTDGALVIQIIAGDAKEGLWVWDGWLQAYLSAAGQAIFGQTAFGARFFHTLAGALVPLAAYPLFRAMSRRRGVAEAATLLTGLSVPLLVYARQAHYYPDGVLLTILVLRAYLAGLASRPRAALALVVWTTLLFHTNFVWLAFLGAALAIHCAVLRPPARVLARLAGAAAVSLVLIVPFAVWAEIWSRPFAAGVPPSANPYIFAAFMRHYVLELNVHGAPLALLLLGGAAAAGRAHPLSAIICVLGAVAVPAVLAEHHTPVVIGGFLAVALVFALLGLGTLIRLAVTPRPPEDFVPGLLLALVCAVFVVGFSKLTIYPFFRYVTPLLPILAFLLAGSVFAIFRRGWLAWPVIGILAVTNAASVWPIAEAAERKPVSTLALRGRTQREASRVVLPAWTQAPTLSAALLSRAWQPAATPNLSARSPLRDYIKETTRDFPRPFDVLAAYINARKRPGDRFAIPRDPYPLAYHTGLAPQAFAPMTEPPRWVIPRARYGVLTANLGKWIRGKPYRQIVLDAPDLFHRNRPEPDHDRDRIAREGARVRILERVDR